MISREELNPQKYVLTKEQEQNQEKLHKAINEFRKIYGKPMIITSGVRSVEDQKAIYSKMGKRPPLRSAHILGGACDVWDRDKSLSRFCLDNLDLLKKLGLFIESPVATPTWVHFQVIPPRSGNTVFSP